METGQLRIGIGWDSHPLVSERKLVLEALMSAMTKVCRVGATLTQQSMP